MLFENSLAYARALDAQDPLKNFRDEFHCPMHNGERAIYFCGNSLGLQDRKSVV